MSLITPDFGLLVWMTLIFGIVFFILAKFGFPVITGMVNKRAEHINKALEDARKAQQELEGMQETCRKMLDETRREQAAMLDEARKSSAHILGEAQEQARKEASQLLATAKEEIEVQKREAMNDIRNEIVELSMAISEKILRSQLDDKKTSADLIGRILDEVESSREK